MDKKAKIALAVMERVCDKFSETHAFIDKSYSEECHKKTFQLTRYLLALIISVNYFLCYVVMLRYGLL